jgi:3-hydroxyisobutyrate/3-hydroxypropionate dehydrogenase
VINVSTGRNYNSLEQNPIKGVTTTAAASKDFVEGFSIKLAAGVIRMAVELSKQVTVKTLVTDTVIDAFGKACANKRCAGKDCRSLYNWMANAEDVDGYYVLLKSVDIQ